MPIPLNRDKDLILKTNREELSEPFHLCSKIFIYRLDSTYSLALNGISGSVDLFSNRERRILDKLKNGIHPGQGANESRLWLYLINRGYLFRSISEVTKLFANYCNDKERRSFVDAHIFVTTHCNFNCGYCFENESVFQNNSLNSDLINKSFKAIRKKRAEMGHFAKVVVNIFGGEPLLPKLKPLIIDILSRCRKQSYECIITTNGFYLDEYLDLFLKYRDVVSLIHTTLDGPEAVHNRMRTHKSGKGTFQKITDNIDLVLRRGLRVLVRTNLLKNNLKSFSELVTFYKRNGWHRRRNFRIQPHIIFGYGNVNCNKRLKSRIKAYRNVRPILNRISKEFCNRPAANFFGLYMSYLANVLHLDLGFSQLSTESKFFVPQVRACPSHNLQHLSFLPDGQIYYCPVVSGKSSHIVGRYSPEIRFYNRKLKTEINLTVLNAEPCQSCSLSSFCGNNCPVFPKTAWHSEPQSCDKYRRELTAFLNYHRPEIKQILSPIIRQYKIGV